MNEKTVRLFHKADWIAIRSTMTKTTLNKMTITEDEIDNCVNTLTQLQVPSLKWFPPNPSNGTLLICQ